MSRRISILGRHLALALLCVHCWPIVALNASDAQSPTTTHVSELLRQHCFQCHAGGTAEADLSLDELLNTARDSLAAAEKWQDVLKALQSGEMPPPDADFPLAGEDRKQVQAWLTSTIRRAIEANRDTSAGASLRRLNRVEYSHTMQDLLGIPMDYARDLPPDSASGDGFRNDGQALQVSAEQLEVYLDTARRALEQVIVSGDAPKVFRHRFEEVNVNAWLGNPERSSRLGRQQQFLAKMVDDYPESGEFLVRVELSADLKPDVGFPILQVDVGYRPDTKVLFGELATREITREDRQTFEFRNRIENFPLPVRGQGKYPGLVIRLSNSYDDGSRLPKGQAPAKEAKVKNWSYPDEPHLPTLTIHSVEFVGPFYDAWPPAVHRRILFESSLRETDETAYVRQVLERFLSRAYRRPARPDEIDDMLTFFVSLRSEFPTFEEAMRETLAFALIRPEFLYLLPNEPGDDWQLASRLSYFLWSSPPDQRLRELAAANMLHWPEVLAAQTERMLADPKSRHFVEQFTTQWLRLDTLQSIAVDGQRFPKFEERLKRDMLGETQAFFAGLLRPAASALDLLSADFVTVNEPLARHYGLPGVRGREFRSVALPQASHRGGLLGQAAVLLAGSTGAESHPVRRAVWIRDRLLNDPPAPPPADVPSLEQASEEFQKLSLREQLAVHREADACGKCHRSLDPWGIALENWDAVGLWREESVDATAEFPDGTIVQGGDALRRYMLEQHRDRFAESLVSRMMTYALARPLGLREQGTLNQLTQEFIRDEYQLRELIKDIVLSREFSEHSISLR